MRSKLKSRIIGCIVMSVAIFLIAIISYRFISLAYNDISNYKTFETFSNGEYTISLMLKQEDKLQGDDTVAIRAEKNKDAHDSCLYLEIKTPDYYDGYNVNWVDGGAELEAKYDDKYNDGVTVAAKYVIRWCDVFGK